MNSSIGRSALRAAFRSAILECRRSSCHRFRCRRRRRIRSANSARPTNNWVHPTDLAELGNRVEAGWVEDRRGWLVSAFKIQNYTNNIFHTNEDIVFQNLSSQNPGLMGVTLPDTRLSDKQNLWGAEAGADLYRMPVGSRASGGLDRDHGWSADTSGSTTISSGSARLTR